MAAYNPCLYIKFKKLTVTGKEFPLDIDFFGGLETWRISERQDNIPTQVEVSMSRSLGSVGDQATISIYNSPFYEELVTNFNATIEKLRGYMWRAYIYCWYGDEHGKWITDKPDNWNPAFVGDIDLSTDFRVSANSINDSTITITANSTGHLNQNGHYRKKYDIGISYREIVEDIFQTWIIDKSRYGQHEGNPAGGKFIIVDFDKKLDLLLETKAVTISDNPMNFLNDICKKFDMVWGVNNLIPYIMTRRKRMFFPNEIPEIENVDNRTWFISPNRGMIGLPSITPNTITVDCNYFNQLSLGGQISVDFGGIGAQVNTGESITARVNSLDIYIKSGVELKMTINAQMWDGVEIIRSDRYQKQTGRRHI